MKRPTDKDPPQTLFRYSTRHQTDGERTIAGLQKIEGKRLILQRPAQSRV